MEEGLNWIQFTGGVIALSCWAPLHKQLPAQATPTNLEVPYLQVNYLPPVFHLQTISIVVSVPR